MENKQPSTTCSVTAAREILSTTPSLGEDRSVAFPRPEPEIVQIATEPELRSRGPDPTTGHLEVLYSVDDYYTIQPVTPSLSASGDEQLTIKQPSTLNNHLHYVSPLLHLSRQRCY